MFFVGNNRFPRRCLGTLNDHRRRQIVMYNPRSGGYTFDPRFDNFKSNTMTNIVPVDFNNSTADILDIAVFVLPWRQTEGTRVSNYPALSWCVGAGVVQCCKRIIPRYVLLGLGQLVWEKCCKQKRHSR